MSYLLQEIYGIENKNNQETKVKVSTKLPFFSAFRATWQVPNCGGWGQRLLWVCMWVVVAHCWGVREGRESSFSHISKEVEHIAFLIVVEAQAHSYQNTKEVSVVTLRWIGSKCFVKQPETPEYMHQAWDFQSSWRELSTNSQLVLEGACFHSTWCIRRVVPVSAIAASRVLSKLLSSQTASVAKSIVPFPHS